MGEIIWLRKEFTTNIMTVTKTWDINYWIEGTALGNKSWRKGQVENNKTMADW